MSDTTGGSGRASPAQSVEKLVETKQKVEAKEAKLEKIEIKEQKLEVKEHKDSKIEKLEKNEAKEHKDAKVEKAEKNEAKEHKDAKLEKIEHKEIGKLEHPEKTVGKEKDGKEIVEQGGNPGDPVELRLSALEQSVASLQHFITSAQRPDLSRGALSGEPGGTSGSSGREGSKRGS
ncbi:MAG: hypothetical protein JO264_01130 [Acidisphaera sp.]|nr:hypothetical protein [Acidisphaera sp.]